jgi:hypothetical protein
MSKKYVIKLSIPSLFDEEKDPYIYELIEYKDESDITIKLNLDLEELLKFLKSELIKIIRIRNAFTPCD